jgi:ribonuclease HI
MFTDAGSRGNPGHAAIGYVIYNQDSKIVAEGSKYIGIATNNVAEYTALLLGCIKLKSLGCTKVNLFLDSELVVKQMLGLYKIKKPELLKIQQKILEELKGIEWTIHHVYRDKNKHADMLVNRTLDNR